LYSSLHGFTPYFCTGPAFKLWAQIYTDGCRCSKVLKQGCIGPTKVGIYSMWSLFCVGFGYIFVMQDKIHLHIRWDCFMHSGLNISYIGHSGLKIYQGFHNNISLGLIYILCIRFLSFMFRSSCRCMITYICLMGSNLS